MLYYIIFYIIFIFEINRRFPVQFILRGSSCLVHLKTINSFCQMFRFLANMANVYVTAFGTASSSATLPVTMNALEDKNGVDPRISRY